MGELTEEESKQKELGQKPSLNKQRGDGKENRFGKDFKPSDAVQSEPERKGENKPFLSGSFS